MGEAKKLLLCYAEDDAKFVAALKPHFRRLIKAGQVEIWCLGADPKDETATLARKNYLQTADIILLCISSSFFERSVLSKEEEQLVEDRRSRAEARVLPIQVRAFADVPDWLANLKFLPSRRSVAAYRDLDEACVEIAQAVQGLLTRSA